MKLDQLHPSVSSIVLPLGVRTNVTRAIEARTDSFVGDQFLFLEVLRGELLRDSRSSAAAVMLRVTRAVSNSILGSLYCRHLASAMDPDAIGKKRADLLEAAIGALVNEGDFENAARLTGVLYSNAAELPTLRFPDGPIERDKESLGKLSATAADGIGILFSRLLIGAVRPPLRELHSDSQMVAAALKSVWRGTRKRPSAWCQGVLKAFAESGVGAALSRLEAPFAKSDVLSQVSCVAGSERTWALVRDVMIQRAASPMARTN